MDGGVTPQWAGAAAIHRKRPKASLLNVRVALVRGRARIAVSVSTPVKNDLCALRQHCRRAELGRARDLCPRLSHRSIRLRSAKLAQKRTAGNCFVKTHCIRHEGLEAPG